MNPKVRAVIYDVFMILALLQGAAYVFYPAMGWDVPHWLYAASAVQAFIAGSSNLLARLHLTSLPAPTVPDIDPVKDEDPENVEGVKASSPNMAN